MKPGPGGYAGVVSRGIAFAIDATIALVASTLGFQLTRIVLTSLGAGGSVDDRFGAVTFLFSVPVVFGLYCATFWALIGRTPGMMLLGLRVVTADGGLPNVRRSIVRAVGYWVSAIAFAGFVWIVFDERSQGFHDKLAGTFVVYDWGTVDAASDRTAAGRAPAG
jgi:uncharacterized RDD family membrane protein YckC